jgi:acyl-CoA synthetase (NDP forming)
MTQETARAILQRAHDEGRTNLTAAEAADLCRAYGIPMPAERTAADAEAAVVAARAIGYPVALKVLSADILHKSDAGGIKLGLGGDDDVRAAFSQIMASAKEYDPKAKLDGVLVQQMAGEGREVIVGASTDPTFGKVVAWLGGIFAEVIRDVTFALVPVSPERARAMLAEIQGYPVLSGARGTEPVDLDAIASVVTAVSQLVSDFPELAELDLNPVFARPSGALAVDARVVLRRPPGQPSPQPRRDPPRCGAPCARGPSR